MTGGTYTLLIELVAEATVEVGALGDRTFEPGWYAYTGSALGRGGFARVDRHYRLAEGERDTRHWHVDHLLTHPAVELRGDVRTVDADVECAVAGELGAAIPGFGASDCDCAGHLARLDADPVGTVRAAHDAQS